MRMNLLAATALSTTISFLVPGYAFAQTVLDGETVYDWNGFYAGLGIGGVTTNSTISFDYSGSAILLPSEADFVGRSGTISADVGHNWQVGNALFGIEADANIMRFVGTSSGADYTAEERLHSLLSLRGRAGLVFDRFMLYGTAGIAAGDASFSADVGDAGKGVPASASGIVRGTVVGVGTEVALNDKMTLRASVKQYNLSPLTASGDTGMGDFGKGGPDPDPFAATYNPRPLVFEAGLNVRF
ncbi:MAG: outer membrane beta-barrel protein [Devosia sp.]